MIVKTVVIYGPIQNLFDLCLDEVQISYNMTLRLSKT